MNRNAGKRFGSPVELIFIGSTPRDSLPPPTTYTGPHPDRGAFRCCYRCNELGCYGLATAKWRCSRPNTIWPRELVPLSRAAEEASRVARDSLPSPTTYTGPDRDEDDVKNCVPNNDQGICRSAVVSCATTNDASYAAATYRNIQRSISLDSATCASATWGPVVVRSLSSP